MQKDEKKGKRPTKKTEPPMMAGRVPPHNLDAEAAVLSALLLVRLALDQVRGILKPEHFYSDANTRIYEAILALADEGKPVDIVSVANYLRERETLIHIGGPSYLAQLSDATPAVGHVASHAVIVFECWVNRQVIAICQRFAAEGYGDIGGIRPFIGALILELTSLAAFGLDDSRPRRVGELIKEELDRLAAQHARPHEFGGIPTGFGRFDKKTAGMHSGDLTLCAARPGMGKTSFVLDIAKNVGWPARERNEATNEDAEPITVPQYGACIFSLEMPREQIIMRLLCSEGRVDLGKYRTVVDLQAHEWGRLLEAADALSRAHIWIDDTASITVPEIAAKVRTIQAEFNQSATFEVCPKCRGPYYQMEGFAAWFCPICVPDPKDAKFEKLIRGEVPRQLTRERKVGVVAIDYLQLIKAVTGESKQQNREQEIASISRGLKQLAKELRVPTIALAQLSRTVETRKDKHPQLSDLRESGSLEQDADTIVFIYRDEYYNPETTNAKGIAELIIAKQRNGSTGRVLVRFSGNCTRFDNLAAGDYPEFDPDMDNFALQAS